jgi:hypothetical protein
MVGISNFELYISKMLYGEFISVKDHIDTI